MGFFGLIDFVGKDAEGTNIQSTVKNLNVRGVTITVPEDESLDVRWVGMIAGSNRGVIENCSAEGIIHDGRTNLVNVAYFGALVGRNNDSKPAGKIAGSNNMLVQEIDKAGGVDFSRPVLLGYTGLSDVLLKKYILDSVALYEGELPEPRYTQIGSVVGTHAGPGALGVAFFKK